MNDDELWAAIDVQRLRNVEMLQTLTPKEWERPSLCEGWTVRDVAAHLSLEPVLLGAGIRSVLRHPGGMNHIINATARDRAKLSPDQIVAELRGKVGSHRPNVGLTVFEMLIDIVVHGQDMAVPSGRTIEVPPGVAATAASRVWDDRNSRKSNVFKSLPYAGHRLTATDTDWSVGEGPEIRGTALALLLLLTGRPVVLPQLEGQGAIALAERLKANGTRR